ncbi:permease [Halorhabdus rudnickae]|uniref:permease n=1 Tax=Halorhabdus rudnickae TaxID=1775544 RepID=UPI001082312C|nr:permease [Halorhabdus rudnickae]
MTAGDIVDGVRRRVRQTTVGDVVDVLLGGQWNQRVVVLGAIALYGWLALTDLEAARQSAASGLGTFTHMFTLILASLLIASALETLLSPDALADWLGEAAGARGVVLAGLIGGALPGGPYAVYPIVRGVADRGASYPAMLAMLVGYSVIGLGRVPFGLVFFETWIIAARLVIAVLVTVVVGLSLYAAAQTTIGGRLLSFDD